MQSCSTLNIAAPAVFKPLDQPSRYKRLHGGRLRQELARGDHARAARLKEPGIRVVCAREIQKTLAESAKRLIADQIASLGVGHMFRVQHDRILTPGDGSITFWGLADKNAESIKSLEAVNLLTQARREGRICEVHIDPLLEVRAFFDMGLADATSIWLAQFSGGAVHVIDYIEGVSQPLAYYVNELRSKGCEQARCILPHDGVNKSVITGKRYEDHLRDAGFQTEVIPNAGAGAARMRIEAVRRILPRCHFDEKRCEAGLEALAWYHERLDDHRGVGLGPLHDWSSHAADSFGLLAVSYEEPSRTRAFNRKLPLQLGSI